MIVTEHVVEIKIAVNDETPEGVDILAVYDIVENKLSFVRQDKRKREELFSCSGCEANEVALFLQRLAGNPAPRQEPQWQISTSNVGDGNAGMSVGYAADTNVRGPEEMPF
jgi:hypothetical protein